MKRRNLLLYLFTSIVLVLLVAVPSLPAQAEDDISIEYFPLTYQQQADLYLGKAGVFVLSSSYNATATVNRIVPDKTFPADDLEFFDRWLDFGIYDYYGNPYLGLWGFNYVYFNLKYQTRRLWDEGELGIYRWDITKRAWVECPTYLVEMKNLPHGRVTCVMTAFGLYGIAIEK